MTSHVLLLGAGCSRVFDFPLTDEFVQTFESENTLNTRLKNELDSAQEKIKKNDFLYDVESLLDYLQGFSNPAHYMRNGGPFRSSLCLLQPIKKLKPNQKCQQLKNLLEEHMINKCYRDGLPSRALFVQVYNRLLSKINGKTDWKTSNPNWGSSVFEIFTTNFDNSLDSYATLTGQPTTRGYILTANNEVIFQHEEFDNKNIKLKIYKLHGSVEFHKLVTGKIISQNPPSSPGRQINGITIESKVMIYGIDKNLLVEPYLDLLVRMKKSLLRSKKCTVIGYSFRDSWIKQIFEEIVSSENGDNFEIELISPTASGDTQNLQKLKKNIVPIDKTLEEYLELQ